MKVILLIFFSLVCRQGYSQEIIGGAVLDDNGNGIPNVSVTYKRDAKASMLGFSKTSSNGKFRLTIENQQIDSIIIEFNHIGFSKLQVKVPNKSADYSYILHSNIRKLEEIKVAAPPIYISKDTINYSVNSFTSEHDRSIEDVLKKLPGIEMIGDEIQYQGKPIEKFMVNNLDLMGGRYSMINKNLPAEAVLKVQVVENDQPIKILDSLVFSDRASLNLVLKKFTTTGTGKIGVGVPDRLWDVNITPMTFGRSFQVLNSFQSNNTGNDVTKTLVPLYPTGSNIFSTNAKINDGPYYIHLVNPTLPGFDERKWLDNRVFLLSSNLLKKMENGMELKGNISYFNDRRNLSGFTTTQFFGDKNLIINTEGIENKYRSNVLETGLLIEKNEKNIYLKNQLIYRRRWNDDRGEIKLNGKEDITQNREYTDQGFMNSLTISKNIGKQLVSFGSTIEYHNTPQNLSVYPGQFQDFLNSGKPYEELSQNVLSKNFHWDNNISLTKKLKNWRFTPTVKLTYKSSKLETSISATTGNYNNSPGREYINDVLNSEFLMSLRMGIGWEKDKWRLISSMPYNAYFYSLRNYTSIPQRPFRNSFNPSTNLFYNINSRNEVSVRISGGNEFQGLDNLYDGYILRYYRSIQRFDSDILESKNLRTVLSYDYKNILGAFFGNFSYSYFLRSQGFMLYSSIDSSGRTEMGILDLPGQNSGHSMNGSLSKFFPKIKTILKFNSNIAWSASDYIINNNMAKQNGNNIGGSFEIINNFTKYVSGNYIMSFNRHKTTFGYNRSNTIIQNNHFLNLVIYPHNLHALSIRNSLYRNNVTGSNPQYFLDMVYRFKINKLNADLELGLQNVLNNTDYIQQHISEVEYVRSTFNLRPRQFMVSTSIRF